MKRFLAALLCGLLIAAFAITGLALVLDHYGMGDVTGITKKVRNPENLIQASEYTFKSGSVFNGVTIDYNEDGVMMLHGQATAAVEVCLGEYYVLDKSFYTMSVYCPEPARTSTGTKITDIPGSKYADSVTLAQGSFAKCYTFENTKLQHVKVFLTISEGDTFDYYTVAPCLVAGKTIGQFYINETINI